MRLSNVRLTILTFFTVLFSFAQLFAANSGKIIGIVTDANTDEPIIGVNIILSGTTIGGSTDENGEFFITQIPAGVYTVEAIYIGYSKYILKEVRVSSNRPTNIEIELSEEFVTGEIIEVIAERPAVDVGVATSAKLITAEEIKNIPAITSATDLVALQTGVVRDGENIHIRGGRSDEVLYLIDGVPASNPVTGVNAIDIDVNQIEEIEIITGGFDAEYGNAQSGVINIITKSGREKYELDMLLKSDNVIGDLSTNYDHDFVGFSGPMQLFDLIGMPGKSSFNINLTSDLNDTYHRIGGGYGETDLGLFSVSNRQNSSYRFSGQLDYQPWAPFRIKLQYRASKGFSKGYNWAWKDNAENLPVTRDNTQQFTAIITHTIASNTFYQLSAGYTSTSSKTSLLDLKSPLSEYYYESTYFDTLGRRIGEDQIGNVLKNNREMIDFSKTESQYSGPQIPIDIDNDNFIDFGTYSSWNKSDSKVWNIKFDITKHFGKIHELKSGFNFQTKEINYLDISDYNSFNAGRDSLPGNWPEYGRTRWFFNDIPWDGSFYIQDRINYSGMFLNIGARADFYVHGETINDNNFVKQYNYSTGRNIDEFDKVRVAISPRIGLSIPANEQTKVFFNYGYFTQSPSFSELYRDPYLSNVIGNPNLDPRKSITYEVGFESEFIPEWVANVKIYGRDFAGSIGFRLTDTEPQRALYENTGFGSSRGFEVELRKTYSDYFAFTLNYTYLLARGFDLTALDAFERGSITPPPVRSQRLGWDVNNNLNFIFNFNVLENKPLQVFGLNIEDFGFSMLGRYNSGYPYTPTIPNAIYVEANSNGGPSQFYLDATIEKGFRVGGAHAIFFVEAINLLDFRNVNVNSSGYNRRDGKVYDLGDLSGGSNEYLTYQDIKYLRSTHTFEQGRLLRMGLKFRWN